MPSIQKKQSWRGPFYCFQGFTFHEAGASAVLYAPQHYQLVTAGKKGQVALWDVRQNKQQVHFFKAHDHPIKCIAIDPSEDLVVTGAVDGDIKVRSTTTTPLPLIMFVTLYG